MTDIVWLLRNDVPCNGDIDCAGELCNQAADEIERLRAAVRDLLRLVEDDIEEYDSQPHLIDQVCDRARAALEGKND